MNKRILAAFLALCVVVCPVWAIFGISFGGGGGDIVHDPINYEELAIILAELIKSYEQLKALYDLQLNDLRIVPVDMLSRYQTLGASWYGLQLGADRFGNMGGWVQAVNGGGVALGGYASASIALQPYGPQFAQLAADEQAKVASQYGTAELADGSNIHAMEAVGMMRANAPAVERAIAGLESDSLSLDPRMNTTVAILNKINAASIAGLRSARDTNTLLLNSLEQQLVTSKRQREAEVAEINANIARLQYGDEAKARNTRTLSDSLRSFRWQ